MLKLSQIYVILGPVLILILVVYLKSLGEQKSESVSSSYLPYKAKYILTKTEYAFFQILKPLIEKNNYIICPKVGLKDIVQVTDKKEYMKWFSKINQKHVDFLICDNNLKPVFALELDDKSHEKEKARKNDVFKDTVFEKIGLPLKRIKVNEYDNLEHIFDTIKE